MHDPFALGDALGPAKVIHVRQPEIGLRGTLVVDNVAAGPSIGGLRIGREVTTEECFRLARAMTFKNAAAGLRHGGGKSVLVGDPHMPRAQKERLVRAFACALRGESDYVFGPDMGTDEACMGWVHDEIGRAVGLPRELGGIPLDELGATGFGLRHAAEVAAAGLGLSLAGARVVIQGFGSVGIHAARQLAGLGARIVGVADSRGGVADPDGFDVEALVATKRAGRSVAEHPGAKPATSAELIELACEIWIPAARPDAIGVAEAERLRAKLVVPGANIAVTAEAERSLAARGVLCLPDFIVNAGGVICAAAEYRGATERQAFEEIAERIRANTQAVIEASRAGGILPREAAAEIALARVQRAMRARRWGIYS
jgi:glutamate dehydrogenase (NAD(P)+)